MNKIGFSVNRAVNFVRSKDIKPFFRSYNFLFLFLSLIGFSCDNIQLNPEKYYNVSLKNRSQKELILKSYYKGKLVNSFFGIDSVLILPPQSDFSQFIKIGDSQSQQFISLETDSLVIKSVTDNELYILKCESGNFKNCSESHPIFNFLIEPYQIFYKKKKKNEGHCELGRIIYTISQANLNELK